MSLNYKLYYTLTLKYKFHLNLFHSLSKEFIHFFGPLSIQSFLSQFTQFVSISINSLRYIQLANDLGLLVWF